MSETALLVEAVTQASHVCDTCRGTGRSEITPTGVCPTCHGRGWLAQPTCRT